MHLASLFTRPLTQSSPTLWPYGCICPINIVLVPCALLHFYLLFCVPSKLYGMPWPLSILYGLWPLKSSTKSRLESTRVQTLQSVLFPSISYLYEVSGRFLASFKKLWVISMDCLRNHFFFATFERDYVSNCPTRHEAAFDHIFLSPLRRCLYLISPSHSWTKKTFLSQIAIHIVIV